MGEVREKEVVGVYGRRSRGGRRRCKKVMGEVREEEV